MLTAVAALTFTLSVLALLVLLRQSPPAVSSEPLRTWELRLPRDAQFGRSQATAWFGALVSLLSTPDTPLTLEFASHQQELQLRLTAPGSLETALRGQLAAWFPHARLEPAAPLPITGRLVRVLTLAEPDLLPLSIADRSDPDPLLGIIGHLVETPAGAGLRFTLRAAPHGWKAWAERALAALHAGRAIPARSGWRRLLTPFLPALAGTPPRSVLPETLKAAAAKCQAPVLAAHLSLWVAGDDAADHRTPLTALAALFTEAFRVPSGNRLVPAGPAKVAVASTHSRGPSSHWQVLSAAELAALFHLPPASHPLIPTAPARQVAAAPARIAPAQDESDVTWLGQALTGGEPQPFGLAAPERRLHLYVVGKTGTGKSTFLANLARQDLQRGGGLGLIDPHGDLAEQVLSLVPPSRVDEVLYFNAADWDYPVAFNLLSAPDPAARPLVASGVVGVFKKLYGDSWGPRLEHFLRNAVLALLETPDPSLLSLPRFLTDKAFRQQLLTYVQDPLLRTFFQDEFERYDPRWRAEALSPILNKVGQFLASPVVRHIVGQAQSGFDLRQVMDRGGIFVANLASGRIGEDNCDLLGGLLVAGFQLAAMSRAELPEGERRDFALLVDEFQHFANDAFASILSEARKYRLALTLSHQYLAQVPPALSEAVFGNVGSLAAFRIGGADAARLAKEFTPVFDGQDLVHLPNHHLCVRLAHPTGIAPAFSARTLPPPVGAASIEPLLAASRERWARPRAAVEAEILAHWTGAPR